MVVTVASSGSMGAKCLLMVLMTPHSPHLGTSPAHSVSLSASPTTATLDQPSALPRYQHGSKTDSPVIEVICGGWLRAVYVIDAFISEHRSSTSITEDLYLEIQSKYLYYPRVQCDHVSPHCPVSNHCHTDCKLCIHHRAGVGAAEG